MRVRLLMFVLMLSLGAAHSRALAQQSNTSEDQWSFWGQKAKTELKLLSREGRATFRAALLACSVYADNYDSTADKRSCEAKAKLFVLEFSKPSSTIDLLFRFSIVMPAMRALEGELDASKGIRSPITTEQPWKVWIKVLERAYRETR